MSATSAADYPTLGFDPTPGDVDQVQDLVGTLSSASGALTEIASVLHGADDGAWRGEAAVAFRALLDDELRPKVDRAAEAFGHSHRHIASWTQDLAGFQREARTLERRAAEAQERAEAARSTLASLPDAPPPWAPPPETAADRDRLDDQADRRSAARSSLSAASGEVDDLRSLARNLHDDYERRGGEVARLLEHSIGIAPEEPGWFDSICEAVGDALDSIRDFVADLGDMALDLLHEWAPILDLIGDIAGALSGVLGLLSLIPFLAPFCGPAALALGGVALVTHYLAAAGESGSFAEAFTDGEFLMDAAGLALGFGALRAAQHLDSVVAAAGNARTIRTIAGTRQVTPGLFTMARTAGYQMETGEFVARAVSLKFTQAGLVMTAVGGRDVVDTGRRVFTGDVGPVRNRPSVVR